MKARELIEKLKKVPPETEVVINVSAETGGVVRYKDQPDYVHIQDEPLHDAAAPEDKL